MFQICHWFVNGSAPPRNIARGSTVFGIQVS
jgi:hypothetical protein